MKITTAIVGTKHLGTEAIRALAGLQKGDTVMLLWDNQNQHDDNAVACFSAAGTMVGFIPRNCQHQVAIARALRAGELVEASVTLGAIVEADLTGGWVVAAPKISVEWAE